MRLHTGPSVLETSDASGTERPGASWIVRNEAMVYRLQEVIVGSNVGGCGSMSTTATQPRR